MGGSLRQEVAVRVHEPAELTKCRSALILNVDQDLRGRARLHLQGRFWHDLAYELADPFPRRVKRDLRNEAELREAWLDVEVGGWSLRLGKQQIVWGEAIGLFVADTVNAKDLREFTLPDFDQIRIPQWALDAERDLGGLHVELVLIPIHEFHDLGVVGTEFRPQVPEQHRRFHKPPNAPDHVEAGVRLSAFLGGCDLNLFYIHQYEGFPSWQRTPWGLRPTYLPVDRVGGSFALELRGAVVRGEAVYTPREPFEVLDPGDDDGLKRRGLLRALLGADRTLGPADLSLQLVEQRVVGHRRDMLLDRHEEHLSVWANVRIAPRLEGELFAIWGLNGTDAMVRPRLKLRLHPCWELRLGADLFEGQGVFGQFDRRDRVYLELRFAF